MTENVTYCDKHVSSRKCIFFVVLPLGLPPLRGIEHRIDLIPGAPLPNKAPYRINPEETKEIQRQVQQPIDNGHVHESLSPCAVPVILVPKKDSTYCMCSDCRPSMLSPLDIVTLLHA